LSCTQKLLHPKINFSNVMVTINGNWQILQILHLKISPGTIFLHTL
jgi:hypothetical protein